MTETDFGVLANELSVARFEMERLRDALLTYRELSAQAFQLLDADLDSKTMKLLKAMAGSLPGYRKETDEVAAVIARAALLNASPAPVKASSPPVKAPAADPGCPYCGGLGEYFGHSPDCRSDDCALAGGIDDCAGVVEPCPCVPEPPAPDARMPESLPQPNHPEIPDSSPPAPARAPEDKGACQVCGCEEVNSRNLWTCECPAQTPAPPPLSADCTRLLPPGVLDDSTYEAIENALDRAEAPHTAPGGKRYLTLVERVQALCKPAPPPLDPAAVAELERLHEAATPGPWWPADSSFPAGKQLIARVPNAEGGGDQIMSRDDTASFQREANARLIAAMRNNLPAILSALRGGHD